MQSGRGGGLADALKQYGVLRSHSITQQAGIQIEENRSLGCSEIFYLDNSIERETSEVSIGRLRFCTISSPRAKLQTWALGVIIANSESAKLLP